MHDSNTLLELVPELGVSTEDVEAFEATATTAGANLAELRETDAHQRIAGAFRLATELLARLMA